MNLKRSVKNFIFATILLCALLILSHLFLTNSLLGTSDAAQVSTKDVAENPNRMFDVPEFKYLIPKTDCSVPLFITLVHSGPMLFGRRTACRDTWAHSDPRTKIYFLMGMVESASLQQRINEEEEQFHDIIQGNFIDSYRNMTYKHTMALRWFTENCPHVKYLLKLDDDVFVNVPAVHAYLSHNTQDTRFLFSSSSARKVHRYGKHKVTLDEFVDDQYPEFVHGHSIIYSNDVVLDAYKKTFTTPFFWIDDVYVTGLIRIQLNVSINEMFSLRLGGSLLNKILNDTTTALLKPIFLVTEHSRTYNDMMKLWEMTAHTEGQSTSSG